MKYIAVFCGASDKAPVSHREAAKALGKSIAQHGFGLVFGGVKQGLMGEIAESVLSEKGKVTGVITAKEKAFIHPSLTQIIETKNYEERNQKMADLSVGVIFLPGGLGTACSFFEELQNTEKPICLLNIEDFFSPLINFFQGCKEHGYVDKAACSFYASVEIDGILKYINRFLDNNKITDGASAQKNYLPQYVLKVTGDSSKMSNGKRTQPEDKNKNITNGKNTKTLEKHTRKRHGATSS